MCREDTPTLDTVIPDETEPVGGATMMGPSHVDEPDTAVASATEAETAANKVSEIISLSKNETLN